jgi:hypothetical protein
MAMTDTPENPGSNAALPPGDLPKPLVTRMPPRN